VGVQAHRRAVDRDGQRTIRGVRPGLARATVAGVDLLLRTTRGAGVRIIKALTGTHRVQRTRAPAASAAAAAVSGRDDVRLDRSLRRSGRVAGGHSALIEGALCAVAVVAAGAQDDGALLAHRVVARDIRPRAVVERGQGSGLRVAALDRPVVRAAVDDGGGVPVVDRRVVGVVARVDSGEQAVLQVRVDPRAVAGAVAPYPDVAEGDRFHGAVAVVAAVGLGVAVVEAAAAVVVRAVEDGVLALGVV